MIHETSKSINVCKIQQMILQGQKQIFILPMPLVLKENQLYTVSSDRSYIQNS